MKRIIYIIIVFILTAGFIKFFGINFAAPTISEEIKSSFGEVYINKNVWRVEIAVSETQKMSGLSNRKSLRSQEGMLFVFTEPNYQYFWMKDMLIDLDMIFFDENWKIVLIEKNLNGKSFPKTFGSNVKSKYVMEINAGEADSFGLKLGDQAIFLNE